MRASNILSVLLLILLHIQGVSQSEHDINETQLFSGSYNNVPLKKVIKDLMAHYRCFYYSRTDLMNLRVSFQFENLKLHQVLKCLSTLLPIDIVFSNNAIIISRKSLRVNGKVIDVYDEEVSGASVINNRTGEAAITDSRGRFVLHNVAALDTLVISHINCVSEKNVAYEQTNIIIRIKANIRYLIPVEIIHNGYQKIPVTQATGSFKQVNMEEFTRIPRFNVQEGLGNNLSGYLPELKTSPYLGRIGVVRGRSSIRSNVQALVVIDDFPFYGDLNIINPYDIESITVANDASSTAIWGARAANGVIVITTKKARYKQPVRVSVNNFVTGSNRPNVFYMPAINAMEYISLEERAYENGFYATVENQNVAVSPVIETLIDYKKDNITISEKDAILNSFKKNDLRSEVEKFFYQPALTGYSGINLSGSMDSFAMYGSVSYGRSIFNERGIEHNRKTILINTQFRRKKLSFTTGTFYSVNKMLNNFVSPPAGLPYLKLMDADGIPLSVPYQYNRKFVDSAVRKGNLLDWNMRPLQELSNADNNSNYNYLMANVKGGYQFSPSLQLQGLYQYGLLWHDQRIAYNLQTFYARNLINNFTQITSSGIERPIPVAPIVDEYKTVTGIKNWRLQLNFNRRWKSGELTMITGIESQRTIMSIYGSRIYGYNSSHMAARIDYRTFFPQYLNPAVRTQIPMIGRRSDSTDFYFSYLGNAFYTWSKKITMSLSLRRDQSNRFGMNTNHKFIPLWAAGALVHLHKFSFFPFIFPEVSLRGTIGKTGNDGLQTSWAATISHVNDPASGLPVAYIDNPGNANLQFEEMRTINIGMDIKTHDRRIQLSVDVYRKKGDKLLAYNKVNPTSGVYLVKSNTGRLSGFGIDANVHTVNLDEVISWKTNGWVSYTTNKVQSRELLLDEAWQYADPSTYVPLKGYPVDAIFAFPMGGLDKQGDPLGYLEGKTSKNYWSIITLPGPQSLMYMGSATPTIFGSITNTFQYKNLMLSIQISGKFNYFFRRTSLNPYDLLQGAGIHGDYYKRWQSPGDELKANVPAFPYIIDQAREIFYKYSTVLVERGDHIRLQNLHIMYNWKNIMPHRTKCISIQTGITFNNLGIIWRAGSKNIDPDVVSGMLPVPRSITLSLAASL
jgi:TonB-linked SusC/RagA family outer membrane protein